MRGTTCSCARKKSFTDLNVTDLARALLGARLVVRGCGGLIIETEAYAADDPASHSFPGQTLRNRAMFGPPGHAYVHRSYGIHLCLNVVGRRGEAVLIRALMPESGLDLMATRRPGRLVHDYCAGPGKLTAALGVTLDDDGKPFDGGELALLPNPSPTSILTGPRIGITKATDKLWRFGLAGYPGLSRPFPPQGMSNPGGASSKPSN